MKKRHLFWIIPSSLICFILLLYVILKLISVFHPLAKPIVRQSSFNQYLSEKELKEDIDYIKHYMETCYVGYDDMVEKGFNLDSALENIYNSTKKEMHNNTVSQSIFANNVIKQLITNNPLIDSHFSICNEGRNPYKLYFSDLYFEKLQNSTEYIFTLIKNEREKFDKQESLSKKVIPLTEAKIGQQYTGSVQNLYEWFDGNKIIYRYGVLSNQNINYAIINLDNNTQKIPVYSFDRLEPKIEKKSFKETEKTLYISLKDFMFHRGDESLNTYGQKEFQDLLNNTKTKSKNKENIIIDLRSNGGGEPIRLCLLFLNILYANYDFEALEHLFSYTEENSYDLISSTIAKGRLEDLFYSVKEDFKHKKYSQKFEYEDFYNKLYKTQKKVRYSQIIPQIFFPSRKILDLNCTIDTRTLPKTDFEGTIYILTDRYSASCSEYTIGLANKLAEKLNFNVIHLGENTNGAVYYVNPWTFVLPNSGLWFYTPTKKCTPSMFENKKFKGEGYGWYPDYWVTKYNLANTLTNLIDDSELPEMLIGLEKNHL